jgi:N-acetylglucosaminyldiphosphoundecaprenol N-acetyl-beta-D-mannosaminyltransferase
MGIILGLAGLPPDEMYILDSVFLALAVGAVTVTLMGLADDIWGLTPWQKILGQVLVASVLVVNGMGNALTARILESLGATGIAADPNSVTCLAAAFVTAVIVLGTNSMNLIDGHDGLASGVTFLMATAFACVVASSEATGRMYPDVVCTLCLMTCVAAMGATLGFLPHNFHPATIFLGDAGSNLLGYLMAVIALMLSDSLGPSVLIPCLLIWGLPLADTSFAILRRWIQHRPLFKADRGHAHHVLMRKGFSVRMTALVLYGVAGSMAASGVAVKHFSLDSNVPGLAAILILAGIGIVAVLRPATRPVRLPKPACAILDVGDMAQPSATVSDTPPVVSVRGTRLCAITEAQCVDYLLRELEAGRGGFGITVNLEIFRQCQADAASREIVDGCDLWVADGMTILWASRLQGTPLPERVCGSNLIWSLSAGAAEHGRSVYFLGGNPGTAERAARILSQRYPGFRVAGAYCPAFGFERNEAEIDTIRQRIADARPDIVYIALGFPKGEHLIQRIRTAAPAAWWLGVGISFSFVCGDVKRAPAWMQHSGLEWVHRLMQEPRRLGQRYLIHGPCAAFPLLAACAWQGVRGLLRDDTPAMPAHGAEAQKP